MHDLKINGY